MELLRTERDKQSPDQQQELITHVVVPLIQNIAAAVAVSLLTYIAFLIAARLNATPVEHDSATFWSIITGAVALSLSVIWRFFGDDIGLVRSTYKAGAASRQDEINRLHSELAALRTALNGKQRPTASQPENERISRLQRSHRHAVVMLENGIRGRPIDRRTCKSQYNIGEVDFARAYRLLQESAVRNEQDAFTYTNIAEAKKHLNEYYTYHYKIAASNSSYNPPWL